MKRMMIMIMVHIGCLPFLLQWLIIQLAEEKEEEEGEVGKRNEAAKMFSRYDFYQYRNHGN